MAIIKISPHRSYMDHYQNKNARHEKLTRRDGISREALKTDDCINQKTRDAKRTSGTHFGISTTAHTISFAVLDSRYFSMMSDIKIVEDFGTTMLQI